jgi:hypothetical protein
MEFEDDTLVFLTTPGRSDLLALNPGGKWGYPRRWAKENPHEQGLAGVQGGVAHFGYVLPSREDYEPAIADVGEFGGVGSLLRSWRRRYPYLPRRPRRVRCRNPIRPLNAIQQPRFYVYRAVRDLHRIPRARTLLPLRSGAFSRT